MATTGFWPVYNHLKETIAYAENPDKTIDRKFLDDDLWQALQYVENSDKTDQTMYVSAINCPKQKAYEYMMRTKRRFHETGKMDYIIAFSHLAFPFLLNKKHVTIYALRLAQQEWPAQDWPGLGPRRL